MTRYGQTVAIAATTSGVAGTIVVPRGARLMGINIAFVAVDDIPTKIAVTYAGQPAPLNFVVPLSAQTQTTQASVALFNLGQPLIDLNLVIDAEKTITFTVTSTGNITVRLGLMWDAA